MIHEHKVKLPLFACLRWMYSVCENEICWVGLQNRFLTTNLGEKASSMLPSWLAFLGHTFSFLGWVMMGAEVVMCAYFDPNRKNETKEVSMFIGEPYLFFGEKDTGIWTKLRWAGGWRNVKGMVRYIWRISVRHPTKPIVNWEKGNYLSLHRSRVDVLATRKPCRKVDWYPGSLNEKNCYKSDIATSDLPNSFICYMLSLRSYAETNLHGW